MRLRVGFDGRTLSSPAAGVRRYTSELIRALSALDEPLDLVMLGGDPAVAVPSGVAYIPEPPHPPTNAGWVLVGLPLAMRRGRVDLLHGPAYTAPFLKPAPVVLTIHDVSYARHPEWFPYRRDWIRRAFYRRSALSATIVVTDSTFSAEEIHAAYGIDRSRIIVVPLGVDSTFKDTGAHAALPRGVTSPFVLHVGDLHERRNLPMVLRAVLAARRQTAALSSLSLVMAGVDRGVGEGLLAQAREASAPDAAVVLGKVGEPALHALYRSALALVYPSLYEGFGLPLLEAMACGTPVVASNAASIPEVVGDAGLVLDPHDSGLWTRALGQIATDLDMTARLRAAGQQRAQAFTWQRTARETLAVYRKALPSRAGLG